MWPLTEIFRCRESVVFPPEDDDGSQRGCQRIFSPLGSRQHQALLSTLLFLLHYSYMSARRNGDEPKNSCNVQNWLVPVGQYDQVSFIKEYASKIWRRDLPIVLSRLTKYTRLYHLTSSQREISGTDFH